MYKAVITTAKEKMNKTLAVIQKDLTTLRAGRANPQILDKITVDYYGTPTPINQVGILKSDVGITPSNDGKVIRLMVPELNEERRKELSKQVKKMVEEGKVAIRAIRRDANDHIKKLKKDSQITEDDVKTAENELQKVTDNAIKEADKLQAEKEKEIMSV